MAYSPEQIEFLRKIPLGAYFSEEELQQCGPEQDRLARLLQGLGSKLPFTRGCLLEGIACLQFEPRNQIAWRRLLALTHWIATAPSEGTEVATVSEVQAALTGIANRMPFKELALEDDPAEGPFVSEVLTPWGPLPVLNGQWTHDGTQWALAAEAVQTVADEGELQTLRRLIHFGYILAKRIEVIAKLPKYALASEAKFEERDLHAPDAAHASAVTLTLTQWNEARAEARVDDAIAEQFILVTAQGHAIPRENVYHSILARRPIVRTREGLVIANPAGLLGAILEAAETRLSPNEWATFQQAKARALEQHLDLALGRMGCRRLARGQTGRFWYRMDERRALLIIPLGWQPTALHGRHPAQKHTINVGPLFREAFGNIPPGVDRVTPIFVECFSATNWNLRGDAKRPEAMDTPPLALAPEVLTAVADLVGHDPLFWRNYARDYFAAISGHETMRRLDPPEYIGHYVFAGGFPLSSREPDVLWINVVGAGVLFHEAHKSLKRTYMQEPLTNKWRTVATAKGNRRLGIFHAEDGDASLVLTHTPAPLWLTPAATHPAGFLHPLTLPLMDSSAYWLSTWSDLFSAPAWKKLDRNGIQMLFMATEDQVISGGPRPAHDREPRASVGRMSGHSLLAAAIEVGSPDFLERPANDYEHFLAYALLFGIEKALGARKDSESHLEEIFERLRSKHERRLIAGIAAGPDLVAVPGVLGVRRTGGLRFVQNATLAMLADLGMPPELPPGEAPNGIQRIQSLLWPILLGTLAGFDKNHLIKVLLDTNEAFIHDRARAHLQTTLWANMAGKDPAFFNEAIRTSNFVDEHAPPLRWLIELATDLPYLGKTQPAAGDVDDLLALAQLYFSLGMFRDGYRTKQIRSPFSLDGRRAFRPAEEAYAEMVSEQKAVEEEAESRWAHERAGEYWPERRSGAELPPPPFDSVFEQEAGTTFVHALEIMRSVVEAAETAGTGAFVTTWTSLVTQIAQDCNEKPDVVEAVLAWFTHRPITASDQGDPGPWNPRLPNALVLRPIVRWEGDRVGLGPRQLARSLQYAYELADVGKLPGLSDAWRHAQARAATRGDKEFERETAVLIEKYPGWTAKPSIPVHSLGGPRELGDFDVLAVHETGHVVAIECKHTAGFVAPRKLDAEYRELYRKGGKMPAVERQERRLQWLRAHPEALGKAGLGGNVAKLRGVLVTHGHPSSRRWATSELLTLSLKELEMNLEDGLAPSEWRPFRTDSTE